MVHDNAFGVQSTGTGARVLAFIVPASELGGALGASYAFGSTSRRGTDVIGQARAHRLPRNFFTLAVGSAGRWATGIALGNYYWERS